MTIKSLIGTVLTVFALMLIFNAGAYAQKTDCSKVTEEQVVQEIYKEIRAKYEKQESHINVRFKDGTVTLEGWTTTKKIRKDIEKIAKRVSCVKRVVNNLKIGVSGGCASGTKPCGDICIPSSENCNIRTRGN